MSATANIQKLIDTLEAIKGDAEKHDAGQHAAGTRVRKVALEVQKLCGVVRKEISADRTAREA